MVALPLSIIITHFMADWVIQTNWMALNKSRMWQALLLHTSIYSLCFLPWGIRFAFITFLTHTLTDAVTSRLTSRWWFVPMVPIAHYVHDTEEDCPGPKWTTHLCAVDMKKRKLFFLAIGADQLIHYITLALTLRYL